MIDFHNHIIPDVDDGSKNIDMSISMLKTASHMGIRKIVSTTHYNHPFMKEKFPNFNIINSKLENLKDEMKIHNLDIEIISKAENFFDESLVNFINDENLTIGDKYMLIEFDFRFIPNNYEKILFQLQLEGITPIIAHPERYKFVQKNYDYIKNWIDKGYKLQLTCGSILGNFGKQCLLTCNRIMDEGDFHLIGSDAHNNKNRNFAIKECMDYIKEKSEKNFAILNNNHENLLNGKELINCNKLKRKNNFFEKIKKLVNY
tara:strand:+ start:942 stop:1721 length:780 start_codon:yes stop_codon:yes gene_type:complete